MLKILRSKHILVCGLFPSFEPDVSLEQYKEARGLYIEDPWDRVKSIFSKSGCGEPHPEMMYAGQMFQMGLAVGFVYGGITNKLVRSQEYLRTNETTIFQNKKEAMKTYINYNTASFLKGGFRWAPAFGIFLGSFSLISSCCEAYRNKPNILDSTVAGFVVGGFCRLMYGIKGFISGGVVGGALGTVYGIMTWTFSKLGKTDQVELKYTHFALSRYREKLKNQAKERKSKEVEVVEKSSVHSSQQLNPLNQLGGEEEQPGNSGNS